MQSKRGYQSGIATLLPQLGCHIFQSRKIAVAVLDGNTRLRDFFCILFCELFQLLAAGKIKTKHHTDAVNGLSCVDVGSRRKKFNIKSAWMRRGKKDLGRSTRHVKRCKALVIKQVHRPCRVSRRHNVPLLMREAQKRNVCSRGKALCRSNSRKKARHIGALKRSWRSGYANGYGLHILQSFCKALHQLWQIFDVCKNRITLTKSALARLYGKWQFEVGNNLSVFGTDRRRGGIVTGIDANKAFGHFAASSNSVFAPCKTPLTKVRILGSS